jgi:hypothetical protein
MSIQVSHLLFDIGDLAHIEKSEHTRNENGEYMRSRAFTNLTRLFLQRDISPVMEPIFDGPVFLGQIQQTRGIGTFGCEAGDAIHERLSYT